MYQFLRSAFVFGLVFLLCASSHAQVAVEGFEVQLLADGLNGPEGIRVLGAGQVIVVESGSDLAPGQPREDLEPRLLSIRRNGSIRVLAEGPDVTWVDVELDPSRGYFVTELVRSVYGNDPAAVQRVRRNGATSVFASFPGDAIGITVDRRTGDLYLSNAAARIERIAPDGTVAPILNGVRANGLCHLGNDQLLAAIWRDFRFGDPGNNFVVNSLIVIDLATGGETTLVADLGSTIGFLACRPNGEIFVTDHNDGEVRRLTPDQGGYAVETFASGFSGTSISFPGVSFNGVAVGADGTVYVSDFGAGDLYAISRSRGH